MTLNIPVQGGRRRSVRRAAALVALAAVAAGCSTAASAPSTTTTTLPPLPPLTYAYVTTIGSGSGAGLGRTMVPVDVTEGGVGTLRPVSVGTYPDAIAIAPGGRTAYVTNYTSNTVAVVDLAKEKTIKRIPLGPSAGPAGIAITPNGKMAYVTEAGAPGTLGSTVTPIKLANDALLPAINVGGGPQGIAITPNGEYAYVADAGAIVSGQTGAFGNTVTPIDLATARALAPITVGNAPTGVAITPDGSLALVTNLNSGSVSPISVGSNTAGTPITVTGAPIAVATRPGDSDIAYVADTSSGTSPNGNVTPIDLTTDTAGAPISVGKSPQAIAVTANGSTAWVVCYGDNSIVPIDLSTNKAGTAITVLGGPSAIAVANRPRNGFPAVASTTTTSKPKAKKSA